MDSRPDAAQRLYKPDQSLQDGTRTMLGGEASAGLCRKSLKFHCTCTKEKGGPSP
jgi:hypothetical protein